MPMNVPTKIEVQRCVSVSTLGHRGLMDREDKWAVNSGTEKLIERLIAHILIVLCVFEAPDFDF